MIPYGKAAQSYYKDLPDSRHRTGDIWTGFPTFDLFPNRGAGVPAIIITPACDLYNNKTHTITYLPILTVRELLAMEVGYDLVRPSIQGILNKYQQEDLAGLLDRGAVPDANSVGLLRSASTESWSESARTIYLAGLSALQCLQTGDLDAGQYLKRALPKKDWERFRNTLVKNSFSDDLHFLPPEQPVYEFSAIREASVVLFRYPMTIHRVELDKAAKPEGSAGTRQFSATPLKVTRLEREFLSDLLTRFARLYIRLGSTDFTDHAITSFANMIDET